MSTVETGVEFMKRFMASVIVGLFLLGFAGVANATDLENGLGGTSGFGESYFDRNDDGSLTLDLSSVFPHGLNFFGTNYSTVYLNNNGNVTFASPLSTYTPYAITGVTSNPIIAPYFADVDTRGTTVTPTPGGNSTGSNLTWYDLDTVNNIFTATWDDVGYYDEYTDLLNAFQLSIEQVGTNGDFDFTFRYEDINWTTGDASDGVGGLGGEIARAGFSSGNGTNYFELPQSGDQDAMLALEDTLGNTGQIGLWQFQVRNGSVVNVPTPAPEPSSMLLGLISLGGLAVKRFRKA